MSVCDIPTKLPAGDQFYFICPVQDSKEIAGKVLSADDIRTLAKQVLKIPVEDIPGGSLSHDTEMMLTLPQRILKEWRVWVIDEKVVTASLYKDGTRVVFRAEIDEDAHRFAQDLVHANPNYACAYVMDICRTPAGLYLLETNCINAAGFYASDLVAIVRALEALPEQNVRTTRNADT